MSTLKIYSGCLVVRGGIAKGKKYNLHQRTIEPILLRLRFHHKKFNTITGKIAV